MHLFILSWCSSDHTRIGKEKCFLKGKLARRIILARLVAASVVRSSVPIQQALDGLFNGRRMFFVDIGLVVGEDLLNSLPPVLAGPPVLTRSQRTWAGQDTVRVFHVLIVVLIVVAVALTALVGNQAGTLRRTTSHGPGDS